MKGKINKQINKPARLCHLLPLVCSFALAGGMPAWAQTTATQSDPAYKGSAENVFVYSQQGTGSGDNAANPAPVGNKTGWTTCGVYTGTSTGQVTYVSGEIVPSYESLPGLLNNWVMAEESSVLVNLTGQAPFRWSNDCLFVDNNIGYAFSSSGNHTLAQPVAFDPRQLLVVNFSRTLILSAEGDDSYALPIVSLFENDRAKLTVPTNPKAIASVEQLKIAINFPKKENQSIYANCSMPFQYTNDKLTGLTYVTYDGGNRAANGTAGQTNWKSVTGQNWAAVLNETAINNSRFISTSPQEALDAVRGVRYDENGNEKQIALKYAYSVDLGTKSEAWKAAHFGWNVINNGATYTKQITLSDEDIAVIQYLYRDGGYKTLTKNNGAFYMAAYTAYFVQTTQEQTTTNAQTRAARAESAQPLSEAVLELLSADGTVHDCILATAGPSRPGRNVQKMGVGQRNLYIEKEGMKCAATNEEGLFAVRVVGKECDLRLASIAAGVSATWNGVPISTGETFAAADGVLRLYGIPTATEKIDADAPLHVWGTRAHIVIEGPADGTDYRIVTASGAPVVAGKLTESSRRVFVGSAGVYIVTIGERSFKVAVK